MATWDITIPAGTFSETNTITPLLSSPPSDFDGATIDSVTLTGSPSATSSGATDDSLRTVWWIASDSSGTATYGSNSETASIMDAFLGPSQSSTSIFTNGGSISPAPTIAVAADWTHLGRGGYYSANMKDDGESMSWSSFTLRVTYTPLTNPDLDLEDYRFEEQGTAENSPTQLGAANTALDANLGASSYLFRLRFGVVQQNADLFDHTIRIQARKNGSAWFTDTSIGGIVASSEGSITAGNSTTQQITDGTFDSTNSGVLENNTTSSAFNVAGSQEAEILISRSITPASFNDGDTIEWRLYDDTDAVPLTSTVTPTMNIVKQSVSLDETLDDLTADGSGSVSVDGDTSETLDDATADASGSVLVQGTLSETLGAVTLDAEGGAPGVTGTLDATLADISLDGVGSVEVAGTTSETLGELIGAASGSVDLNGATDATLADMTLLSDVSNPVQAALNKTLGPVLLDGSTTVSFDGRVGTVTQTLDEVTLDASGTLVINGDGDITLTNLTLSSDGSVDLNGDLSVTLDALTLEGVLRGGESPVVDVTLGELLLASTAGVNVDGSLSSTLEDAALFGTIDLEVAGSLSEALSDLTGASVGQVTIAGTLSTTLGDLGLTAAAESFLNASLSATLGDLTVGSGVVNTEEPVVDALLDNVTLVSNVTTPLAASLGVTLGDLVLEGEFLNRVAFSRFNDVFNDQYREFSILTKDTVQDLGGDPALSPLTAVNWDSTSNMAPEITVASNDSKIYFGRPGRYRVKYTVSMTNSGANRTVMAGYLRRDGSTRMVASDSRSYSRGTSFGGDLVLSGERVLSISSAGQYVEVMVEMEHADQISVCNTIASRNQVYIERVGD